MLGLILIAALAQNWDALERLDEDRKVEQRLNDALFEMAVEESILREPSTRPPEPFRTLLGQLGDGCFKCRERASSGLESASKNDRRWLYWGRKYRDPEIRLRANTILRRLTPCVACNGVGKTDVAYWVQGADGEWGQSYRCKACDGKKTSWKISPWD